MTTREDRLLAASPAPRFRFRPKLQRPPAGGRGEPHPPRRDVTPTHSWHCLVPPHRQQRKSSTSTQAAEPPDSPKRQHPHASWPAAVAGFPLVAAQPVTTPRCTRTLSPNAPMSPPHSPPCFPHSAGLFSKGGERVRTSYTGFPGYAGPSELRPRSGCVAGA